MATGEFGIRASIRISHWELNHAATLSHDFILSVSVTPW